MSARGGCDNMGEGKETCDCKESLLATAGSKPPSFDPLF